MDRDTGRGSAKDAGTTHHTGAAPATLPATPPATSTATTEETALAPPAAPSGTKLAIEFVPLLAFLVTYAVWGIKAATAVLMVATVLSVIASWRLLRHVAPMLWLTTALVCGFGALTLFLDDPRFIKIKPTVAYIVLAAILGVGLLTGRLFLKIALGEALKMTDAGWTKLTLRWIGFFIALAALNEVVWRTLSETAWVNFKVFGILPLTFAFMLTQIGLIGRHAIEPAKSRSE